MLGRVHLVQRRAKEVSRAESGPTATEVCTIQVVIITEVNR